eukprot:3347027-Karenia_brevis.AAC.1
MSYLVGARVGDFVASRLELIIAHTKLVWRRPPSTHWTAFFSRARQWKRNPGLPLRKVRLGLTA